MLTRFILFHRSSLLLAHMLTPCPFLLTLLPSPLILPPSPFLPFKFSRLLEIELDGIFKCMLLLKKKKYAAIKLEQAQDGSMVEVS
jgi:hypothetical protein